MRGWQQDDDEDNSGQYDVDDDDDTVIMELAVKTTVPFLMQMYKC
jgi:hypothetical protein